MSGAGEGLLPLVLLHGFGGTHRVWDGVRAALGEEVRTLAYDLPGHGGSLTVSEAGGANVAAKVILSDLESRGVSRFHLAGHSFGGAVSVLMALAEPERIASLTLFAPGGFGPEINAPLLRDYASAVTRAEVAHCLSEMYGRKSPQFEKAVDHVQTMRSIRGQREALQRLYGLITRDGKQGVIPGEKLASLAMPVCVAWGGQDRVVPVTQTRNLPPHFSMRLFSGLGHMLPEEAPDEMARLLRRFPG